MRKYCYLDLKNYMNHKMVFDEYVDINPFSETKGAMGLYILEPGFNFVSKIKYLKQGGVRVAGSKNLNDNIKCDGQSILLPEKEFRSILIIGFHETGSYTDAIKLVTCEGTEKTVDIMMYQMMENLDMLYECDLDSNSEIAFSAMTNLMVKIHYYVTKIDVVEKYSKIILPKNEETHIVAISLIL